MLGSLVNGVKKLFGFSKTEEAKLEAANIAPVQNQTLKTEAHHQIPAVKTEGVATSSQVLASSVNNQEIKKSLEKTGVVNPNSQKSFTFIEKLGGVSEYRLNNGLKVLLKQDNNVPLINTQIIYHVGSKDDPPDKTGMAHFLEHLSFGGSKLLKEGELTQIIELNGGDHPNAFTSHDSTVYPLTLPLDKLELALKIEADKMRNLNLDQAEIEKERDVIKSEIDQGENDPSEVLTEALLGLAYKKHPYGNSIAGTKEHLDKITRDDLLEFYNKFYQPDNATLVISGNFIKSGLDGKSRVMNLVSKYFGQIQASGFKRPERPQEPEQKEPRKLILEKTSHEKLVGISYPIDKSLPFKDMVALKLISQVLYSGANSRMYVRTHQEDTIGINTSGSVLENVDSRNYFVEIDAGKYVDLDSIQEIVDEELDKVVKDGFTEEELKKWKSLMEAAGIFKKDGISAESSELGYFAARTDWKNYPKFLETVKSITNEDIKRVAKQVFNKNARSIVHLKPRKEKSASAPKESKPKQHHQKESKPLDADGLSRLNRISQNSEKLNPRDALNFKTEKMKLDCGAELMLKERKEPPLVYLRARAKGGQLLDPPDKPGLAALTMVTLMRSGTKKRNQFEFLKALDSISMSYGCMSSLESFGFIFIAMKDKLNESLALLKEALSEPKFDKFEFESQKRAIIASLKQQDENPALVASREMSQKLYPKGHPLYQYSPKERIELIKKLKVEDAIKFYEEKFKPADFKFAVSGDLSLSEFNQKFSPIINSWNRRTVKVEVPKIPAIINEKDLAKDPVEASKPSFIVNNAKQQTEVQLAQNCPLTLEHPDYYAMMFANHILGFGLKSRLSRALREKGLTYGIGSDFSSFSSGPGSFKVRFGCNPQDIMRSAGVVNNTLEQFYEKGITDAELEATKIAFKGSYFKDNFDNGRSILSLMSSWLFRSKDEKEMKRRLMEIDKLSTKDGEGKINVNKIIKKYMNPKRFHTVIVGPELNAAKKPEQKQELVTSGV